MELDFLFYAAIIYAIFAALFIAILFPRFKQISEKRKKKRLEKRNKFFRILAKGIENELINTTDDVFNMYFAIFEQGTESVDREHEGYDLPSLLREFLVELLDNNKTIFKKELNSKTISKFNEKINEFIKELEKVESFDILPFTDRNILSDLAVFVDEGIKNSAKQKISELADLLVEKNENYLELNEELVGRKRVSAISIIITIISIVVTITVGLYGIIT